MDPKTVELCEKYKKVMELCPDSADDMSTDEQPGESA